MTRTKESTSKDLGHRAFGTSGGWKPPGEAPGGSGEVIALAEEILRMPVVPPMARAWKPRAGRIYNFPVGSIRDEK